MSSFLMAPLLGSGTRRLEGQRGMSSSPQSSLTGDVFSDGGMGHTTSITTTSATEPLRKKRARVAFSNEQVVTLEKRFYRQRYLSSSERADLARSLGLTETQVDLFHSVNQPQNSQRNMDRRRTFDCFRANLLVVLLKFSQQWNNSIYLSHN